MYTKLVNIWTIEGGWIFGGLITYETFYARVGRTPQTEKIWEEEDGMKHLVKGVGAVAVGNPPVFGFTWA